MATGSWKKGVSTARATGGLRTKRATPSRAAPSVAPRRRRNRKSTPPAATIAVKETSLNPRTSLRRPIACTRDGTRTR